MNGVIGGTSLLLDACANLTVEQKEVLKIVKTSGEVMLTMSVALRARTQECQSADMPVGHMVGARSLGFAHAHAGWLFVSFFSSLFPFLSLFSPASTTSSI